MTLLICTQKVNKDDPILGFFHNWIIEFAKNFDFVTVICLEEGNHNLPPNVKVLSLGKESGEDRKKYTLNFYKYIWNERKNYDVVFVHMNQIYVVLGGIFWRIWGKTIALWYTHRAVSLNLKIATFLSNIIFTSSKESFRVETNKVRIIGHGIDFSKRERDVQDKNTKINLISVGRITRIKNLDTLIEALDILKNKNLDFVCEIVGPRITPDDNIYFGELKKMIVDKKLDKNLIFREAVSHDKIGKFFSKSHININLTPTGGVDKVVLEGIMNGAIPLVSNEAFRGIFGPFADKLIFKERNSRDLAQKIESILSIPNKEIIKESLRRKVEADFSLPVVIKNIRDSMIG